MQITIKWLRLTNFKGVRNLSIDFGDRITNISGANATGKTTIFDAFTWLLFGKNSDDAKDFNIKTIDADNQPIHRLSHEVEALLMNEGREIRFKRVFKEKWTKKRGNATDEFTGHETEYYVDDVPLSQREFQVRVDFIMNESIAKMVTNPLYFNSLKWQDRRVMLESIVPHIADEDIAGDNTDFIELLKKIGNESVINFRKKIAAQKTKIKDTLATIPPRIDELQRSIPHPVNYDELRASIAQYEKQMQSVEDAIELSTKAHESEFAKIQAAQQQRNSLQLELSKEKTKREAQIQEVAAKKESDIIVIESRITGNHARIISERAKIEAFNKHITMLTAANDKLREEWVNENAKTLTIDDHAMNCPTCRQRLPEEQRINAVDELTANFNNTKQTALKRITNQGQLNKKDIDDYNAMISELNSSIVNAEKAIADDNEALKSLQVAMNAIATQSQIISDPEKEIQQQIEAIVIPDAPVIDNEDLKKQRAEIRLKLSSLHTDLASEGELQRITTRIKQLNKEEKAMAQELADLERQEFTLSEFVKLKINSIEQRINSKFALVKFKMFEQQINGGEVECCECMVNGVPFSDLNNAMKINAGIDIINVLSEHYNVIAPIFIDNRESVNELINTQAQLINLIVSKEKSITFEKIN